MDLVHKEFRLKSILSGLGRTLVAYSGGVDSAYLAYVAHQILGGEMLALIADSPSLARAQLRDALDFAAKWRIPLQAIQTSEITLPDYVRNDGRRCYFCKEELFSVMRHFAGQHQFQSIVYGANLDDQGDFRPGQRAANEHLVTAPLIQAELRKEDIRELARKAGLEVWNRPASP